MPIHPALPWTLRSIARLERAGGIRAPRLTEPSFEKWNRIRRHLGWRDFVAVLHHPSLRRSDPGSPRSPRVTWTNWRDT